MGGEIERLRAEVALLWRAADEIKRLRAEVERLRTAGDALAVHWEEMSWTGEPEYIAWEEACRG